MVGLLINRILNAFENALMEFEAVALGCQAFDVTQGQGTQTQRRSRPGGRSARVVGAVHKATFDLLLQHGYYGFEIPDVARIAGVHPTTIYRRWQDKQDLVADAMLAHMAQQIGTPDTGSLRGDLAELIHDVAAVLMRPPMLALLRVQVAMADTAPNVRAAGQRFWTTRFGHSAAIVERAIARGELSDGTDPQEFNEFAIAPLYLRVLVTDGSVDDDFIRNCVHRTLRAFDATGAGPAGSDS
ncbi:TetR/AcrR family transcriptional regulator [Nocardia sp. GCM10030253]|uniref:TetR/AcrR family transcriptional regulator n=1 Tax=Nocardia sp. GCM10030253 TaxID=3273404 RepID=UPI0036276DD8